MLQKMLTVVIPVFNGEKYISRALQCLQNQTWQNFNVVIINDGSTDTTKDIIETFIERNINASLINLSSNHGVSYCRTLGINQCKTPYITFLDHDDWVDINTYECCFKAVEFDSDIVIFGLNYDYLDIDVSETKYGYKSNFKVSGDYALKIYGHTIKDSFKITPIINNKIYRLDFLKKNQIIFNEQIRYQEDDIFTFEVLLQAKKVMFVTNCKYHYFQNPKSVIHNVSELSITHFVSAYSALKIYLQDHNFFEKYKHEYYLKLKSSLKGVIHRTVHYSKNQAEIQHLLALLYKQLNEHVDIEEFLAYFDLSNY